ncbi:MAG: STAS domain-containing protein [Ginsengibacter sp.]
MKVKIDTKEKFDVIRIEEPFLSANMTEKLSELLLPYLTTVVKNIILKMDCVITTEATTAEAILNIQQKFYDNHQSFVICELQPGVEKFLDEKGWLELMNVTPTESEAWDIVQMEEIEREFQ